MPGVLGIVLRPSLGTGHWRLPQNALELINFQNERELRIKTGGAHY
jgi:hypothetical protein